MTKVKKDTEEFIKLLVHFWIGLVIWLGHYKAENDNVLTFSLPTVLVFALASVGLTAMWFQKKSNRK